DLMIAGYHVSIPAIDIHTIGAGGGTIAGVDAAGMLYVGPAGAGANPGPACYGLGGSEPTVTDAQLVLGRLRPGAYAGSGLVLDLEKARAAIEWRVARPLGIAVEESAAGSSRTCCMRWSTSRLSVGTPRVASRWWRPVGLVPCTGQALRAASTVI